MLFADLVLVVRTRAVVKSTLSSPRQVQVQRGSSPSQVRVQRGSSPSPSPNETVKTEKKKNFFKTTYLIIDN